MIYRRKVGEVGMLVIRFGKWNHRATPMFVYTRIFRNGCEWTPLCIKKFRYVGIFNADKESIAKMDEHQNCETCKWGRWYRNGYDITMMDEECGGCCSWNSKWEPTNG